MRRRTTTHVAAARRMASPIRPHSDSVGMAPVPTGVTADGVRKPRISPEPKFTVWMLKYARPCCSAAASAASAPSGVPPLAVMNAAFQVPACVVSYCWSMLPAVTPSGKPTNDGVVVATPTLFGGEVQQWMWAIVVLLVRPLNAVVTRRKCEVVSSVTDTLPVADVATGGFSFAPLSEAVVVIWAA